MDPDTFTARRLGRGALEILDEAVRWRGWTLLLGLGVADVWLSSGDRGAAFLVAGLLVLGAGLHVIVGSRWRHWSNARLRWWFFGVLTAQLAVLAAILLWPRR